MAQHSERAKKGTRRQINLQIRQINSIVALKQKEVEKIRKYRIYKLPGQSKMELAAEQGLAKAKKDLTYLKKSKAKYENDGLI